jgi:hypothetical protein
MAAAPRGDVSQTASGSRQQRERRKGQRRKAARAFAIAAVSLGLWWLIWKAVASLIRVLF